MTDDTPARILIVDTVTKLTRRHRGAVVIAGSHGGLYASYLAARAGVIGVILNDAGVGLDDAGIACLDYFDGLGRPAATVAHLSARIGDGEDMAQRGVISHVNRTAHALGATAGASVADGAARMTPAKVPSRSPRPYEESRFCLREAAGEPTIWGIDSISLLRPTDDGAIVIAGSHGALLGGREETALSGRPLLAVFNDAGGGADDAGFGRLAVLQSRGVAAATVAAASARIGDARSSWQTGTISRANDIARRLGAAPGAPLQPFAVSVARSGVNV